MHLNECQFVCYFGTSNSKPVMLCCIGTADKMHPSTNSGHNSIRRWLPAPVRLRSDTVPTEGGHLSADRRIGSFGVMRLALSPLVALVLAEHRLELDSQSVEMLEIQAGKRPEHLVIGECALKVDHGCTSNKPYS